jgi:hypothetical protein
METLRLETLGFETRRTVFRPADIDRWNYFAAGAPNPKRTPSVGKRLSGE